MYNMAISHGTDHSSLFSSLTWTRQPVVFHKTTGKNVALSENSTVATRVKEYDFSIVCTSEPVCIGQMFKVTVKRITERWEGGLVSVSTHAVCDAPCN